MKSPHHIEINYGEIIEISAEEMAKSNNEIGRENQKEMKAKSMTAASKKKHNVA